MKNKLTHNLTHNLGLKILALVFSVGLWFVVNNITDPVIRKSFTSVPVEITNADKITNEGKVYEIQDETDSVTVTVRGKSSIVSSLNKEDIKAVADMSDLSFMNTVTIKLSCTRSNYNSQLELSSSVENLKLTIEDMKRTQFVINTNISGEPADGYVVGTVTPSQNVVRVSGPESIINQIDHVDATVDIRDTYTSDITTSVELKFHDENHNEIKSSSIKTNISAINVVVTILATKEVPLKFAVTGEPASGYLTTGSVVSVPETITIAGRKSVLDSVSEILIADSSLSVEDATEDITKIISAKKYLPYGTQFADSSFNGNVSVTVGVEPEASKELEVPVRNFAIGNAPEGFDVEIKEFQDESVKTYTVAVTGIADDVNSLNAKDVIGVVDMNQMLDKLAMTEWQEGSYTGEITFNFPDDVKTQQSYSLTLVVTQKSEEE